MNIFIPYRKLYIIEKGLVLDKLDEKNPVTEKGYRKTRHHSLMSVEIGINALKSQIWQVIGLSKSSPYKRRFEGNFQRLMGKSYQLELWE